VALPLTIFPIQNRAEANLLTASAFEKKIRSRESD
jgi:hypothetical protein